MSIESLLIHLNENYPNPGPESIHEFMKKFGWTNRIKIIYQSFNDVKHPGNRIFIMQRKSDNRQSDENKDDLPLDLIKLMNGIILEAGKQWRVLFVPQIMLERKITNNLIVASYFNSYKITRLSDTSTIGMYYHAKQWVLSTKSGYFMNEMMRNGITYQRALSDILKSINYSYEDLCKDMKTTHCYSFCIKHPAFHMFNDGKPMQIYFMQSCDLKTFEKEYKSPFDKIPSQEQVKFNTLVELIESNANAFEEYKEKKTINYGYLLESTNPKIPEEDKYILLESSLYAKIKGMIYKRKIDKVITSYGYNPLKYASVNAFVNETSEDFLTLFPLTGAIEKLKIINMVVTSLVLSSAKKVFEENKKSKKAITPKPWQEIVPSFGQIAEALEYVKLNMEISDCVLEHAPKKICLEDKFTGLDISPDYQKTLLKEKGHQIDAYANYIARQLSLQYKDINSISKLIDIKYFIHPEYSTMFYSLLD